MTTAPCAASVAPQSSPGSSDPAPEAVPPIRLGDGGTLDPDAALADVRILRRAIEDVHPGYGRYTSASIMDDLFDALEREASDGISVMALYERLSLIVSALRCDHTKAELPKSLETLRRTEATYMPFSFRLFDGRMYVDELDADQRGLTRGDEVLRINGRPVGRVLEDVSPYVSVDGFTDDTRFVEMEASSEYLGDAVNHFWPCLYGWTSTWTIEARDATTAERRQVVLDAVTYGRYVRITTGSGTPNRDFIDAVRFEMLDDETAYLSVGTFVNYRRPIDPAEVFDPIFDEMRQTGATRLILDLRECGGGSDDVPRTLMTYLTDEPPTFTKRAPWVRTYRFGDLREHLGTWDERVFELPGRLFTDVGDGYFAFEDPTVDAAPPPARRPSSR